MRKDYKKIFARRFCSKGGKERAKKLTPERRREIAMMGARALWAKRGKIL